MPGIASDSLLVFRIGEKEFALGVAVIDRVVRAVEIAPLADAPPGVRGVIEVQGRTVPVFDLTSRHGAAVRAGQLLIIARTPQRTVALLVESVESVEPLVDGPVLIHDLERFLAAADRAALSPGP